MQSYLPGSFKCDHDHTTDARYLYALGTDRLMGDFVAVAIIYFLNFFIDSVSEYHHFGFVDYYISEFMIFK